MLSWFHRPAAVWRRSPVGLGLAATLVAVSVLGLGIGVAALRVRPAHAATLTVSTCSTFGPGVGTLSAALAAAGSGDTIIFTCSGALTVPTTITVGNTLTIDGTGQSVTLSGANSLQVFKVASSGNLTLDHLTVSHGSAAHGAGLEDDGGTVSISASTFADNQATAGPGGGYADGGGLYVVGGGRVTITASTFSGNQAISNGGPVSSASGGGLSVVGGTVTITASTFSGNQAITTGDFASSFGGGLSLGGAGTLTVTASTFSGNQTTSSGQASGGGMAAGGTVTITASTFSGNQTTSTTTFASGVGGGLAFSAGTLTVADSTFSNNQANGSTDGSASGGGLFVGGGMVVLTASTMSSNRASAPASGGTAGRGLGGGLAASGGTVSVADSILAANTADGAGPNCKGVSTDQGYNLDDGTSCGFSSTDHSLSNTDPKLGSLATNGGPTQTMALLPGSPAINRIPPSGANCPATDQRGVSRPQGPACDVGAYEFVPTTTTTLNVTPNPGLFEQSVQMCATVAPTTGTPGPPTGSASFAIGATTLGVATLSGGKGCFSTSTLSVGDHTITARYAGDSSFSTSTSAPLTVSIEVQGQDVAGSSSGGRESPPYNPAPLQAQTTGSQNPAGTSTSQTQQQPGSKPRAARIDGFASWLGTGLGLLLLLVGLVGLGVVFYRASRRGLPGSMHGAG